MPRHSDYTCTSLDHKLGALHRWATVTSSVHDDEYLGELTEG